MEGILTQGFKSKRAKTPPPPSSLPPQAPPDMEYSKNATATSSSSPHGRPASSGDGGPRFLPASVSGRIDDVVASEAPVSEVVGTEAGLVTSEKRILL